MTLPFFSNSINYKRRYKTISVAVTGHEYNTIIQNVHECDGESLSSKVRNCLLNVKSSDIMDKLSYQKNSKEFKKFMYFIQFIIGNCDKERGHGERERTSFVSEDVIFKIMYLLDMNYYELHEKSLTGEKYVKTDDSISIVAPKHYSDIRDYIQDDIILGVVIKDEEFCYFDRTFYGDDLSGFTNDEKEYLEEYIKKYKSLTSEQLTELIKKDIPFISAEPNEMINYELVFYRSEEMSIRKYEDD